MSHFYSMWDLCAETFDVENLPFNKILVIGDVNYTTKKELSF